MLLILSGRSYPSDPFPESHFLSTSRVPHRLIAPHMAQPAQQRRLAQWYMLGVSIAPLLDVADHTDYCKALGQLGT